MTKAEIVANISEKLGIEKVDVQLTVESLMKEIINSLESGENVYLRGFGSFIVKKRAEKTARNIKKIQPLRYQLTIYQLLNHRNFLLMV